MFYCQYRILLKALQIYPGDGNENFEVLLDDTIPSHIGLIEAISDTPGVGALAFTIIMAYFVGSPSRVLEELRIALEDVTFIGPDQELTFATLAIYDGAVNQSGLRGKASMVYGNLIEAMRLSGHVA